MYNVTQMTKLTSIKYKSKRKEGEIEKVQRK